MPKKIVLGLAALCCSLWAGCNAMAQNYEITLKTEKLQDSVLYIGQHYRDEFILKDSTTRRSDGSFVFKGKRSWERGVYAFVR